MINIAKEKTKYFNALKDEIKQKYRSKRDQEKLIKDRKSDEWTTHMSRKRE